MSAVQALSYLRERGVTVELDGGNLVLSGADDLSAKTIERPPRVEGRNRHSITGGSCRGIPCRDPNHLAGSAYAHPGRASRRHNSANS